MSTSHLIALVSDDDVFLDQDAQSLALEFRRHPVFPSETPDFSPFHGIERVVIHQF